MSKTRPSTSREDISERKEGDPICLKVNLKDEEISLKLRQYKRQNVTELINRPIKEEKKINIKNPFGKLKFSFKSNKVDVDDMNKTTLNNDLSVFNNAEILLDNSFQSTNQNTSRTNSSFKMLVNEDYTGYVKILKRIYPSFRFNHYRRINNENLEYYKKYGEKGDINNRNFKMNDMEKEVAEKGIVSKYTSSNLLDILGVQGNICDPPGIFKIKSDFLERNEITEINMIKEDLSFKTGVIDKEREHILGVYSKVLYNYIESNLGFSEDIKKFSEIIKKKREFQGRAKELILIKSLNLLRLGRKKRILISLVGLLQKIVGLKLSFQSLLTAFESRSDDKVKIFSDAKENTRQKIGEIKSMLEGKKGKKQGFLTEIESKISEIEGKGESNVIDQLGLKVKMLIDSTLKYNSPNSDDEKNDIILDTNYDLTKPNENYIQKNKIYLEETDFIYNEKNDDNLYVSFSIISLNLNEKKFIKMKKLLITILEMFGIVIRDNIDINSIIEAFNDIFKKIINKNFEIIQNITKDRIIVITILIRCYMILISNYYYLLYLIENNFGLRIKIFNETTNIILYETDNLIKSTVFSMFQNLIYDENINNYFEKSKKIMDIVNKYLNFRQIDWTNDFIDSYQQFLTYFFDNKKNEIIEQLKKIDFSVLTNINQNTQKLIDLLIETKDIQELNDTSLNEIKNENNSNEISTEIQNNLGNNFIFLKYEKNDDDKKHKISYFTEICINCLFLTIKSYINTPYDKLKENIIKKMYTILIETLKYTKDSVIVDGKINNDKVMTEIEISTFYSDIIVIEKCLKIFDKISKNQELLDIIKEIKLYCLGGIGEVITQQVTNFADEFSSINFNEYPVFHEEKGYNSYIKNLTILNLIYNKMKNAFTTNDINNIYTEAFNLLFKKMKDIIQAKGTIENNEQVNQFRNEMTYFKKVFKLFPLVESKKFKKLLNEISLSINPKIPLSKKEK